MQSDQVPTLIYIYIVYWNYICCPPLSLSLSLSLSIHIYIYIFTYTHIYILFIGITLILERARAPVHLMRAPLRARILAADSVTAFRFKGLKG